MNPWSNEDLNELGAAREIEVVTTRANGELGPPVIVWGVRHEEDLYLRSYRGDRGVWYQQALADPHGRILLDTRSWSVAFEHIGHRLADEIDSAYRAKYGDLPTYVDAMTENSVQATTLRVVPTG